MYESLVGRLDLFVRPSAATYYYNLKYTYGDVTLFHSYQLSLALRPTFPFNLKIMNRVGEMHLYIYVSEQLRVAFPKEMALIFLF